MAQNSEFWIKALLALAIVTPSMALGAVHTPVLACYLVLAGVIYLSLVIFPKITPPPLDLAGAVLITLTLYTVVQIIPLPSGVVSLIAPSIYEIRARAALPLLSEPPAFMALTLDVPLTALEVAKLLFYAAVYWVAMAWTRRHGPRYIIDLVLFTGVLGAAVFLAHQILMLDKVYGFYTPMHLSSSAGAFSAPLLNDNHMAGMLGLSAAVAIGKALSVQERTKRALFIGVAALIGGTLMLTLSRGGIAAFVAGQLLFILLRIIMRHRQRHDASALSHLTWLPIGLALSLGLGFFVAQDAIIGEFLGGDVKKLELALDGLPLVGRFWTTGVGRGAFWVGFPLVSDLTSHITFTHAENAVIQLLCDYGVLVGGFALVSALIVVGRFLRNAPDRTDLIAALCALVAFGIHNLVDFNMEVPGVAVIAVALLGTLTGNAAEAKRTEVRRVRRSMLAVGAACSLILAPMAVFYFGPRSVDAEEIAYKEAWNKRDAAPFSKENLFAVVSRHPADWYIPLIAGVRQYHLGEGNPLPWLARAIELNPSSGAAHFYVGATLLRARHLDQAMLELRLATRYMPGMADSAAKLLVAGVPHFDRLEGLAVTREEKRLLWSALARHFALSGHAKEAEIADTAVLKVDPRHPESLGRHIQRLTGRDETAEALKLARVLAGVPDYGPSAIQMEAEIFKKAKQYDKAVAALEKGLAAFPNHLGLLTSLAWAREQSGDHEGALKAAGAIKAVATNVHSRSSAALLEAGLSIAAGRVQEALAHYREAFALDPTNIAVLDQIANLAEQHGDHERALQALQGLSKARPDDARIRARLTQLETMLRMKKELNAR